MKNLICAVVAFVGALVVSSCAGGGKALLPNVSGKAGEVMVVMDKSAWEGALGADVRAVLGDECPYLEPAEPLFTLSNVNPSGFTNLFKVHRNLVLFLIDPDKSTGVLYRSDVWAEPQCVIQLTAPSFEEAQKIFALEGEKICTAIEQAERDRVVSNTLRYEEKDIYKSVSGILGGSPHFPIGYKLRKALKDFVWVSDEKQYTTQGVLIYTYPVRGEKNPFAPENMLRHRNAAMRENVPGMFENTYMTTSSYITPTVQYIKYKGRDFAQMRGFWEVENDFMGGPFVSHSFYTPDGQNIIVMDAFVYAPRYDKRQYLRQVESLLYSFEWLKKSE